MEWEATITAVKKTRLKSPRTVAIVGFASNSREQAPYDRRNVEIWGCNEAYVAGFMVNSEGEFRADRWFQIHKHEDFSRQNNSNDKRHYEWLQQEHNFPIYMQEKFEEIPGSEALPIDDFDQRFFGDLYTTNADGEVVAWLEECEHGFYTSTFAYMMAMAIHLGFEEIEIWGFNMGTQSEYGQQATGGTFWLSAALNRGIKGRHSQERTQLTLLGVAVKHAVVRPWNRQCARQFARFLSGLGVCEQGSGEHGRVSPD